MENAHLPYWLDSLFVLTKREIVKWIHRKPVLIVTLATPIFWITLFGKSFDPVNMITAGGGPLTGQIEQLIRQMVKRVFGTESYFTYVTTGILVVFALFQSMFGAVGVVMEKRIGYLVRLLVSPAPRATIILSKVLGTLVRITVLSGVLLIVAYPLGLQLKPDLSPLDLLIAWLIVMFYALGFASLFTGIAFNIDNQEALFALFNLVNLPLMFTSSALFPLRQMPDWLKTVASVNPLTHATDLVRNFLLGSEPSAGCVPTALAYLSAVIIPMILLGYYVALKGMRG